MSNLISSGSSPGLQRERPDLISSGSSGAPKWGGARKGAGRPRKQDSVRSVATDRNQTLTRKKRRWTKTRVWETRQIGKVHPMLLQWFSKLPPGRGQEKYRKHRGVMVPNTGLSKRTMLMLGAMPYSQQFTFAAILLFQGDVPDEFKPLFEADDETLLRLAVECDPEAQKQLATFVKQINETSSRNGNPSR